MTEHSPSGLQQSIKQKLLNLSRTRGETFNIILVRYGIERFLYRVSQSPYADQFVLKGAMLFAVWADKPHRPTNDVDFLGFGDPSPERIASIVREICELQVSPDGLTFDPTTVTTKPIREDNVYDGIRARVLANLGPARINLQIDVGFGDAITPQARELTLTSMLALPSPVLQTYPPETVVAEKLEAIVTLAMTNSRMKDYFDLWTLGQTMSFDFAGLRDAVHATFQRRKTELIEMPPPGLTQRFARDATKQMQWRAFVRKMDVAATVPDLEDVVDRIATFLIPVIDDETEHAAGTSWSPGGPWTPRALA